MVYSGILDIHAVGMMAAGALFVSAELLLLAVGGGMPRLARLALGANRLGNMLAMTGMLAGIALIYLGGWPLTTPWLLLSFGLIGVMMVVGRRFVRPWQLRFEVAVADASRADLGALAADRKALAGRIAVIGLFALMAAVMMLKPELALPVSDGYFACVRARQSQLLEGSDACV